MTDRNPVKYAEGVLHVHVPWERAEQAAAQYEKARDELADARVMLRLLNEEYDLAVYAVQQQATIDYNQHCTKSGEKFTTAGLERAQKEGVAKSEDVAESAKALREVRYRVERAESEVDKLHHITMVHSARMNELAGLLTFYAYRTPPVVAPSAEA